jgi:alkanesulfonate monooxygenase SsuD/methylene tetrahydromethanopterin reductase-like flavin-dependent oxidoreductase (luciferase family)
MQELEFYSIIDTTYPWFAPADGRESMGIDMSNAMYDRDLGQRVLDRVLSNARIAEQLGYDGVLIFEQHNHPLALFGNAMTGAAWLAGATSAIRIAGVGPILNAYLSPVRLAEEIALTDIVAGGRLIVGLPMGIGAQYHSMGVTNPAHARARYREAVALLHKIWTDDGPFAWEGDHFHVPYVNVWPKPRQDPHPEIFIPAAGSRESLELAAKYRFTYQAILVPRPVLLRNCETFRALCEENGYEANPRQIAAVLSIHVAETDRQAEIEIERHILWEYQNILRYPFHESFPPGHVSMTSLRGMMAGGYRSSDPSKLTYRELIDSGALIAGSPETVRERLAEITGAMGAGRVIVAGGFTLPAWLQHKAMTMFAEQVIPHFRSPDGLAVWQREPRAGYQTATEFVGRKPRYAGMPVVLTPDGERLPLYDREPQS